MAKLMNITQGDYGIVFNIQLLNDKKEYIHILDEDDVIAHIQFPDGTCIDIDPDCLTIIDRLKGLIRIVLSEEYTAEEGYYQVFVALKSDSYKINANSSIPYYVNAKHYIGKH